MRICIITRRLSMSHGGAEMVAFNLSKRLSENGYDVHVVTSSSDVKINDVNINIIKVGSFFSPWKILSFQRKVKKFTEKGSFDIVYSLCQVYPLDIYRAGGGIQKHWMRVQYPITFIRTLKYLTSLVHLAMRWLEEQIFKEGNCKIYITNSSLIKEQIIEYFNISSEKIRVIYNGVDTTRFNPEIKVYRRAMRDKYKIGNDEIVLLFISNNWERKGLSTIIESLPKTEIEKIRVVIVGRGGKRKYISLLKKRRIGLDKLIFTGSSEEIEKYYGMADIFVLPSRYEPFSNVCLEAMACALPVITTKMNGASELIRNGVNGFILNDWRDPHILADLIKILSQYQIREEIGEKAAETAKEYTWERHIKETVEVFRSYQL